MDRQFLDALYTWVESDEAEEEIPSRVLPEKHNPYGIYMKLDRNSRQVRRGRFLPSQSSTIRVALEAVSLNDQPYYEALSYAWGDPEYTKNIEVNGALVPVTLSLEVALR